MGQTLTRAHDELFRRSPDERFNTMQDLFEFCQARKERSELLWRPADDLQAIATNSRLELATDFVPPQESGAPGTQGGTGLHEGDLGYAAVYTARRPTPTAR